MLNKILIIFRKILEVHLKIMANQAPKKKTIKITLYQKNLIDKHMQSELSNKVQTNLNAKMFQLLISWEPTRVEFLPQKRRYPKKD